MRLTAFPWRVGSPHRVPMTVMYASPLSTTVDVQVSWEHLQVCLNQRLNRWFYEASNLHNTAGRRTKSNATCTGRSVVSVPRRQWIFLGFATMTCWLVLALFAAPTPTNHLLTLGLMIHPHVKAGIIGKNLNIIVSIWIGLLPMYKAASVDSKS